MAFTGRLCLKGVPFPGFRYRRGREFTSWSKCKRWLKDAFCILWLWKSWDNVLVVWFFTQNFKKVLLQQLLMQLQKPWTLEIFQNCLLCYYQSQQRSGYICELNCYKTTNLLTFIVLWFSFCHAWLAFLLQHNNIPEIYFWGSQFSQFDCERDANTCKFLIWYVTTICPIKIDERGTFSRQKAI